MNKPPDMTSITKEFPPEVHESLAKLKIIAKAAKTRHDPLLRRATDPEIALSETQRQPGHCKAHSSRTGLACEGYKLAGTELCRVHGQSPALKAAAKRRLEQMVPKAVERLDRLVEQGDHLPTALNAVKEVLDRALGPLRGNAHENLGIQVNIGILGADPRLTSPEQRVIDAAQLPERRENADRDDESD